MSTNLLLKIWMIQALMILISNQQIVITNIFLLKVWKNWFWSFDMNSCKSFINSITSFYFELLMLNKKHNYSQGFFSSLAPNIYTKLSMPFNVGASWEILFIFNLNMALPITNRLQWIWFFCNLGNMLNYEFVNCMAK